MFELSGEGLQPSIMPVITLRAGLHSNATHILSFTNCLDHATFFSVDLHSGDTTPDNFCLLMKRTRSILLHPGVTMDIPISFAPEDMRTHDVTVLVTAEERRERQSHGGLVWRYPVVGQPEFRPVSPGTAAPLLKCRAKERVEQRLEVMLIGCKMSSAALVRPATPNCPGSEAAGAQLPQECENYTYQLVCQEKEGKEEMSGIVQNSVALRLLRNVLETDGSARIVFGCVFAPPKAFRYVQEMPLKCTK